MQAVRPKALVGAEPVPRLSLIERAPVVLTADLAELRVSSALLFLPDGFPDEAEVRTTGDAILVDLHGDVPPSERRLGDAGSFAYATALGPGFVPEQVTAPEPSEYDVREAQRTADMMQHSPVDPAAALLLQELLVTSLSVPVR